MPRVSTITTNGSPPYGGIFDYDAKAERLQVVNAELENPDIWNDPQHAQELGREKKSLEKVVDTLNRIAQGLSDARDLFELACEDDDDATLEAIEADIDAIGEELEGLEFRRMFSNPADPLNCFVDIQAGAGGTEAQDWASMLLRQYLRYAENKDFQAEVLEQSDGEVAGIKSATLRISGEYAYGHLRTETGVHRLVRKSPFDSSNGRHTSFDASHGLLGGVLHAAHHGGDFLRRLRGAFGQLAHLIGNHREAATGLTSTCGLDRRVQRE